MKKKKVLFISSTGGHLNELLQLSPLFEKYDYHIITEKDKTNEYLKEKYGKKVKYLPYGTRSHLLKYIFIYFYLYVFIISKWQGYMKANFYQKNIKMHSNL